MYKRDYIERMIEQLAAAIAQILGLAARGETEEAEQALERAWSSSLGLRRADILRLDEGTLRAMLGDKAELAIKLIEAQATVEDARGRSAIASSLRARARNLASRL